MAADSIAEARQAIFLVRHGDTVREKGNPDVPLSESGERRALALAALPKDSGINVVYNRPATHGEDRGAAGEVVGHRIGHRAKNPAAA